MEKEKQDGNKADNKNSRRDFLKTSVYVAPVILTLAAKPSYAIPGSPCQCQLVEE